MRFLVDAQLPPAVARWLSAQGYEAQHVSDRGMMGAGDREIWLLAQQEHAVIITKDEDFAILRGAEGREFPAVVWIRVGNTRKAELLRWLEPLMPRVLDELRRGETLVEIK